MGRGKKRLWGGVMAAVVAFGAWPAPGLAQEGAEPPITSEAPVEQKNRPAILSNQAVDEVVVYARRRGETALDAPVAVTAFTAEDLRRYNTDSMEDVAALTPGLVINSGSGASGGTVTLRGVGTGNFVAAIDQAVSTNIDGVQISRAKIIRQAFFDLGQIEVLKGPQALFFGKNSPGGIIAVRTAAPTEEFYAEASFGYGVRASEYGGHAIVSGPVTDWLRLRASFRGKTLSGPFVNAAADKYQASALGGLATNAFPGSAYSDVPDETQYLGRFALEADLSQDLTLAVRVTHFRTNNSGVNSTAQLFYCSPGSFYRLYDQGRQDCELDERVWVPNADPGTVALIPQAMPSDGAQFEKLQSWLISAEAAYDFGAMKLTSVTGFYDREDEFFQDASFTDFTGALGTGQTDEYRQISEEVRLESQFEGRFNFMLGGFFQDEQSATEQYAGIKIAFLLGQDPLALPFVNLLPSLPVLPILGPINIPNQAGGVVLPRQGADIDGLTYSGFVQGDFDILREMLTLSVGVRYTWEKKEYLKTARGEPAAVPFNIPFVGLGPVTGGQNYDQTFSNFSPEATLNWQPTDDLNIYASYKQGYKSGGFNSTLYGDPDQASDVAFGEETVEGYEGGVKARLLDGQLALNLNGYWYDYTDLQSSFVQGLELSVINAEAATVRGLEFDFNYRPEFFDGFILRGAFNYNRGRYEDFLIGCYQGQTAAQGCDFSIDLLPISIPAAIPGTDPTLQNLGGQQMFNAPDWSATIGASYAQELVDGEVFALLSVDVSYKGSYQPHDKANPVARQDAAWLFNAAIRFLTADDRFELAVIGTNLTNELRVTFAQESALPSLVPTTPPDFYGYTSMPRGIRIEATARF